MVDKNGKKIIINERLRDTRDVVTCETPGQEYLQRGVVALPPARARPVQRRVVHQEVETAGLHVPPRLGQEPLVAAAQPRLAVNSAQTVIRTPVPACGRLQIIVLLYNVSPVSPCWAWSRTLTRSTGTAMESWAAPATQPAANTAV